MLSPVLPISFLYKIFVQQKDDQNNNKQISTSSPSLPPHDILKYS